MTKVEHRRAFLHSEDLISICRTGTATEYGAAIEMANQLKEAGLTAEGMNVLADELKRLARETT